MSPCVLTHSHKCLDVWYISLHGCIYSLYTEKEREREKHLNKTKGMRSEGEESCKILQNPERPTFECHAWKSNGILIVVRQVEVAREPSLAEVCPTLSFTRQTSLSNVLLTVVSCLTVTLGILIRPNIQNPRSLRTNTSWIPGSGPLMQAFSRTISINLLEPRFKHWLHKRGMAKFKSVFIVGSIPILLNKANRGKESNLYDTSNLYSIPFHETATVYYGIYIYMYCIYSSGSGIWTGWMSESLLSLSQRSRNKLCKAFLVHRPCPVVEHRAGTIWVVQPAATVQDMKFLNLHV